MRTVDQALSEILEVVRPLPPCRVPINDALGRFLAADVLSDVDSPPFDKALMDGYAIRASDVDGDTAAELAVVAEVSAGMVGTRAVGAGEAVRLMTGAPMPDGADAVVPVELTQFDAATETVRMNRARPVVAGANLMKRAASMRKGETVLAAGREIRPQELGALAEIGYCDVPCRPVPRVGVLATGDELVEVGETPGPGQIRNSNETMLVAQIRRAGGEPQPLGIARDNRDDLRAKINTGLQYDMLLLSGGVSAGKLDLVPSELAAAGVRPLFHKVRVKPGKPIWFGVLDRSEDGDSRRCYVFGLPGNPVSSMVCFELFARTALRSLMGDPQPSPPLQKGRLAETFECSGERATYFPCRWERTETGSTIRLIDWRGSADLRSAIDADGLAVFPIGEQHFASGSVIEMIPW